MSGDPFCGVLLLPCESVMVAAPTPKSVRKQAGAAVSASAAELGEGSVWADACPEGAFRVGEDGAVDGLVLHQPHVIEQ